jgi:hypothetical protein
MHNNNVMKTLSDLILHVESIPDAPGGWKRLQMRVFCNTMAI